MWKVSSSCSQPSPQNRLIFHHLFLNMMPGKMDHTIPIPPLQISDPTQCHDFWLPLWLAACQYIICWAGLVYVQRSEQGFSSLPLVFFYIEIFASTHAIRNYIAMNSVVQICLISGEVDFGHGVELIYLIFFLQYIFFPKIQFSLQRPLDLFLSNSVSVSAFLSVSWFRSVWKNIQCPLVTVLWSLCFMCTISSDISADDLVPLFAVETTAAGWHCCHSQSCHNDQWQKWTWNQIIILFPWMMWEIRALLLFMEKNKL